MATLQQRECSLNSVIARVDDCFAAESKLCLELLCWDTDLLVFPGAQQCLPIACSASSKVLRLRCARQSGGLTCADCIQSNEDKSAGFLVGFHPMQQVSCVVLHPQHNGRHEPQNDNQSKNQQPQGVAGEVPGCHKRQASALALAVALAVVCVHSRSWLITCTRTLSLYDFCECGSSGEYTCPLFRHVVH